MMEFRLLYGGLSPFVRKVGIVAHELGLDDRITREPAAVNPLEPNESVTAINPLGKIPALVLADGSILYGATPICEYFDCEHGNGAFFPNTSERWQALRRNALADGILEAGNLARIETLRPQEKQWARWRDIQLGKVTAALDRFEEEVDSLSADAPKIGEVALGAALGWLDVRLGDFGWRDRRPGLTNWFEALSKRPSMEATVPRLPQ
jgi:glutathione S-transferase